MERISYDDFKKLDLRIGHVIAASDIEGADRLILLEVDIGEEKARTIIAGMKAYYRPEDMVGRKIVVLTNLEPRKMRGILSDGMLLAASTLNFEQVKLLSVDGDMPPGAKIS
jgi:methionyl-tRNA synthetase